MTRHILLAAATALFTACAVPGHGTSASHLVIVSLEGRPAAAPDQGTFSHTFASDVLTAGRVLEDPGRVLFAVHLKDPGSAELPLRPSPLNAVTIERYHVRYVRADGRNQPGVDVPHPFDGAITMTMGGDGGEGTLVLVRAQAKLEPPLVGLRAFQGSLVLSTIAEVTFYGRDQSGNVVSATGTVGVNFADWADPE